LTFIYHHPSGFPFFPGDYIGQMKRSETLKKPTVKSLAVPAVRNFFLVPLRSFSLERIKNNFFVSIPSYGLANDNWSSPVDLVSIVLLVME
jgi:hypothetical protein